MSELFRNEVPKFINENPDITFGRKVRETLGYTELDKRQWNLKSLEFLYQKMREKDIRPFNSESVEKYKKRALKQAKWKFRKSSEIQWRVALFTIVASLISAVICASNRLEGFCILSIGICACACMLLCWTLGELGDMDWYFTLIKDYKEPIPEFVLQTAMDVKQICDEAKMSHKLYVCGIHEMANVYPDPFLVLTINNADMKNENLYLEVWNEPTFKGEREDYERKL